MTLPTIKIKDDNRRGWKIINMADFDPKRHVAVDEGPEPDNRAASRARTTARKARK